MKNPKRHCSTPKRTPRLKSQGNGMCFEISALEFGWCLEFWALGFLRAPTQIHGT